MAVSKRIKYIFIGFIGIVAIGFILFVNLRSPKERCEATTVEELNNYYGSEHIIRTEIFWSKKYNKCFVVTKRPFLGTASDWAIEYFGEPNTKDPNFMEAEAFSLDTYPEQTIPTPLEKTYSYSGLKEYLAGPQKYKVWEADFFKQVEQFR